MITAIGLGPPQPSATSSDSGLRLGEAGPSCSKSFQLKARSLLPFSGPMGEPVVKSSGGEAGAGPSRIASALAKLEPFPEIVMRVRRMVADPRCSVSQLTSVVESDVGLATKLLRVANAPASGLAQRCTSVRHAVTLLGLRRIGGVVASAAAFARVEKDAARYPDLAAHAVAVGGVARALAPITGAAADEAFTVGLLHDVGMLVLAQLGDFLYEGLLDELSVGGEPCLDEERELVGVDHAAVGSEALRRWGLPEPLPEVVALHHDWEAARAASPASRALVALVRAADTLVPALKGSEDPPSLDELAELVEREAAFDYLGLKPEELFRLWPGLRLASGRAHALGEDDPPASGARAVAAERVSTVGRSSSAAFSSSDDAVGALAPTSASPAPARAAPATSRWLGLAVVLLVAVVAVALFLLRT